MALEKMRIHNTFILPYQTEQVEIPDHWATVISARDPPGESSSHSSLMLDLSNYDELRRLILNRRRRLILLVWMIDPRLER